MTQAPPGGGRLAARFVVPDPDHVLTDHEVVWDARGRIVALRRARGPVAETLLLPGLVAAHTHVEIEPLPAAPLSFPAWVRAVLASRRAATPARLRRAVGSAVRLLLAGGATAVGDIDATGASLTELAAGPLTGRSYRELTGFDVEGAAAVALVAARRRSPCGAVAVGLSPHAPYSVSADLMAAAARRERHLSIHCAEVPEEQQLLHTGTGPFAVLLAELGRLPAGYRAPSVGAVRWLEQLGVLRPTTMLVHCQELERGDAARIAARGCSVVVCPGTIAFFGRSAPPVPQWLRRGIPVALGTDSRASNDGLSMRRELQRAARLWPELSPRRLLRMATTAGGRALGLPRLGRLARGGRADLLVVPAAAGPELLIEGFVHGDLPLLQVVAGGRSRAPAGADGARR